MDKPEGESPEVLIEQGDVVALWPDSEAEPAARFWLACSMSRVHKGHDPNAYDVGVFYLVHEGTRRHGRMVFEEEHIEGQTCLNAVICSPIHIDIIDVSDIRLYLLPLQEERKILQLIHDFENDGENDKAKAKEMEMEEGGASRDVVDLVRGEVIDVDRVDPIDVDAIPDPQEKSRNTYSLRKRKSSETPPANEPIGRPKSTTATSVVKQPRARRQKNEYRVKRILDERNDEMGRKEYLIKWAKCWASPGEVFLPADDVKGKEKEDDAPAPKNLRALKGKKGGEYVPHRGVLSDEVDEILEVKSGGKGRCILARWRPGWQPASICPRHLIARWMFDQRRKSAGAEVVRDGLDVDDLTAEIQQMEESDRVHHQIVDNNDVVAGTSRTSAQPKLVRVKEEQSLEYYGVDVGDGATRTEEDGVPEKTLRIKEEKRDKKKNKGARRLLRGEEGELEEEPNNLALPAAEKDAGPVGSVGEVGPLVLGKSVKPEPDDDDEDKGNEGDGDYREETAKRTAPEVDVEDEWEEERERSPKKAKRVTKRNKTDGTVEEERRQLEKERLQKERRKEKEKEKERKRLEEERNKERKRKKKLQKQRDRKREKERRDKEREKERRFIEQQLEKKKQELRQQERERQERERKEREEEEREDEEGMITMSEEQILRHFTWRHLVEASLYALGGRATANAIAGHALATFPERLGHVSHKSLLSSVRCTLREHFVKCGKSSTWREYAWRLPNEADIEGDRIVERYGDEVGRQTARRRSLSRSEYQDQDVEDDDCGGEMSRVPPEVVTEELRRLYAEGRARVEAQEPEVGDIRAAFETIKAQQDGLEKGQALEAIRNRLVGELFMEEGESSNDAHSSDTSSRGGGDGAFLPFLFDPNAPPCTPMSLERALFGVDTTNYNSTTSFSAIEQTECGCVSESRGSNSGGIGFPPFGDDPRRSRPSTPNLSTFTANHSEEAQLPASSDIPYLTSDELLDLISQTPLGDSVLGEGWAPPPPTASQSPSSSSSSSTTTSSSFASSSSSSSSSSSARPQFASCPAPPPPSSSGTSPGAHRKVWNQSFPATHGGMPLPFGASSPLPHTPVVGVHSTGSYAFPFSASPDHALSSPATAGASPAKWSLRVRYESRTMLLAFELPVLAVEVKAKAMESQRIRGRDQESVRQRYMIVLQRDRPKSTRTDRAVDENREIEDEDEDEDELWLDDEILIETTMLRGRSIRLAQVGRDEDEGAVSSSATDGPPSEEVVRKQTDPEKGREGPAAVVDKNVETTLGDKTAKETRQEDSTENSPGREGEEEAMQGIANDGAAEGYEGPGELIDFLMIDEGEKANERKEAQGKGEEEARLNRAADKCGGEGDDDEIDLERQEEEPRIDLSFLSTTSTDGKDQREEPRQGGTSTQPAQGGGSAPEHPGFWWD